MVVICRHEGCPARTAAGFCGKQVITLNAAGMCRHWFNEQGQFRGEMWDYAEAPVHEAETIPEDTTEQPPPHNIE